MSTYTRSDIKQAMLAAGLDVYDRHAVYSNLPAKVPSGPYKPVTAKVGAAYENVYMTDLDGNVHQGCMIVAACSGNSEAKRREEITFWIPSILAENDSYQESKAAVTAKYIDVQIDRRNLGWVK